MNSVRLTDEPLSLLNFINGEFVEGQGNALEIDSPYFGKTIGVGRSASLEQIDLAVDQAHRAQVLWAQTPLKERTQVLFRFRDFLLAQIDEIANIVSLENGKTLAESRAGILKGVEVLEFALSVQNLDSAGKMEVSRGVYCEYRRRPIGVVASITPFNFPAMVPMWTIPNALILGNSYVWKPSEKTPLTSKWIVDGLVKSGLPPGVFTVLNGGQEVAERLIAHPRVQAVAFVGSSRVAESVYHLATRHNKRALALGGAKNHIVLLPDADAELAGRGISDSFTGCAGQRCMAASVLLAVGDIQKSLDAIVKRAQAQVLGETMGAIISKAQLEFLHQSIEEAERAGAKILLDGRKSATPEPFSGGYWLGPTILDEVPVESDAARKELFGPILSIIRCSNISAAMEIENSNPYGNACSVFTTNGALAESVLNQASAGMLGVNIGVPVPREPFSFGGIGDSKFGHGEITGEQGLEFFSDLQKVTTKWEAQSDENWMS